MHLTLVVCTRERPVELGRLFDSLGRSRFRRSAVPTIDVVVVDNAPGGTAIDAGDLSRRCGWPTRVVAEPRTGVAYARNTAIANRSPDADFVVSVDDDQVATPSWLDELLAHATAVDADIVTGPVLVRIPDHAGPLARAMWQNIPRHDTGTMLPSFLGGNVCFRAGVFDSTDERYDETQALSTADDADFGRRLTDAGFTIEWTDSAICWELVPDARLCLRWFVERYLSFGGFEVRDARRAGGARGVVVGTMHQLASSARSAPHGVASLNPFAKPETRARHRAAALANTCLAAGWFAGLAGLRVRDYRTVTNENVLA